MTTGTNFGFLLGMCTTMSKFGASFCVIGRRFENHVSCFEAQLLFIVSLLIASRCLIAEQPLSAPVRLAEYLLSVIFRLESV